MTNDELKEALITKRPVIATILSIGDIEYRCVRSIIYRFDNGELKISAELLDRNANSVTTVAAEQIRFKEGQA